MDQTRTRRAQAAATALLAALVLLAAPAAGRAAEMPGTIGAEEYTFYCAGCHGTAGEGGGPIADYYGISPPSLTRLAAENGGKFPLERVYKTIDGRNEVGGHGKGDMQVWGNRYSAEVDDIAIEAPVATRKDLRARLVRGRILELIYFLLTIQKD